MTTHYLVELLDANGRAFTERTFRGCWLFDSEEEAEIWSYKNSRSRVVRARVEEPSEQKKGNERDEQT